MATSPDPSNVMHAPARDPVCGMRVDPETSRYRELHSGIAYGFCSERCREKFAADPAKYVEPQSMMVPDKTAPGVIYTCPMHPQIRQPMPGNCPICGMALEPEGAAEPAGANPELALMQRRFWIGAAFAAPLVILEMGSHFPGLNLHHYVPPQIAVWLEFLLASLVVLREAVFSAAGHR
jgi:Cu+-exporting ATPase